MKDKYTRTNVHDVHMRTVIVRLDFSCECDLKKLIGLFSDSFKKLFKEGPLTKESHDIQISLKDKDFDSISKKLSIPVESVKKMEFVRYFGFKNGACEAFLDISRCYMCLFIKCKDNNYDGLSQYIEPVKGAIKVLSKKHFGFCPVRIGIRKVRTQIFQQFQHLINVFEPFVYPTSLLASENQVTLKKEYIDVH